MEASYYRRWKECLDEVVSRLERLVRIKVETLTSIPVKLGDEGLMIAGVSTSGERERETGSLSIIRAHYHASNTLQRGRHRQGIRESLERSQDRRDSLLSDTMFLYEILNLELAASRIPDIG